MWTVPVLVPGVLGQETPRRWQVRLLHDEAGHELGTIAAVDVPVAVNADSLATWFRDVLAEAASWAATSVRQHVEDQAHSQELLRRGEVLAAVTSDPTTVQGCAAEPLGSLRYVPCLYRKAPPVSNPASAQPLTSPAVASRRVRCRVNATWLQADCHGTTARMPRPRFSMFLVRQQSRVAEKPP